MHRAETEMCTGPMTSAGSQEQLLCNACTNVVLFYGAQSKLEHYSIILMNNESRQQANSTSKRRAKGERWLELSTATTHKNPE